MVKILSESRRRRERRQRAQARYQWWLVKQNHLKPCKQTLQNWHNQLAAHHSRDPRLLKSIKAAMANATTAELVPWKCSCTRLNKKTAEYCGQCGKHWSKVTAQEDQWNQWSQWEGWEDRPKTRKQESSTARSASRRRKNKGKGKGKEGSKKGKDTESGSMFTLPSPFSDYQSTAASTTPWVGDAAPSETSPFQVSQSAQAMQAATNNELAAALSRAYGSRDQMPAEVRELVDKAAQQTSKSITKELHSETSNLGRAKKALVEIVESRRQHRQAWTQHLRDAIALWNKQLQQFTEHQAMLSEREGRAMREIQAATRAIQELNNKAVGGPEKVFTPTMPEIMENTVEEPKKDQEAEELKAQLHKVLTDCAKAAGLEVKDKVEQKEEIVTVDSDKEDQQTGKRQRSTEGPKSS